MFVSIILLFFGMLVFDLETTCRFRQFHPASCRWGAVVHYNQVVFILLLVVSFTTTTMFVTCHLACTCQRSHTAGFRVDEVLCAHFSLSRTKRSHLHRADPLNRHQFDEVLCVWFGQRTIVVPNNVLPLHHGFCQIRVVVYSQNTMRTRCAFAFTFGHNSPNHLVLVPHEHRCCLVNAVRSCHSIRHALWCHWSLLERRSMYISVACCCKSCYRMRTFTWPAFLQTNVSCMHARSRQSCV